MKLFVHFGSEGCFYVSLGTVVKLSAAQAQKPALCRTGGEKPKVVLRISESPTARFRTLLINLHPLKKLLLGRRGREVKTVLCVDGTRLSRGIWCLWVCKLLGDFFDIQLLVGGLQEQGISTFHAVALKDGQEPDVFLLLRWAGEEKSLLILSPRCERNADTCRGSSGDQGTLRETEGPDGFPWQCCTPVCSEWEPGRGMSSLQLWEVLGKEGNELGSAKIARWDYFLSRIERISSLWGHVNLLLSACSPLLFLSLFSLFLVYSFSLHPSPCIFLQSICFVFSLLLVFSLGGSDYSAALLNAVPSPEREKCCTRVALAAAAADIGRAEDGLLFAC